MTQASVAVAPASRGFQLPVGLVRVLLTAAGLLLWEFVATFGIVEEFWISKPSKIFPEIVRYLSSREGWFAVALTFYEAAVGFALAMVLGVLSGFLITRSPYIKSVLNPFVGVMNAVPRLALIPLFIVWFGIGSLSKIMMVFMICYFVVLVNTISAIESVDRELVLVARLLGATKRDIQRKVIIPSSIPWLFAATRICVGNAVGGAVVAEMVAGNGGLGFMVSAAAALLNLRDVFVAVIIVMAIAYCCDVLLLKLERRLLRWRPAAL
ncbi:ABC transporter permease [Bosea sp. (in: a-proteobacteria)]|uniref:ABC transporter permease n=1 Tax=Bosea sp. (in: a-proteobacteria) TaxID=1871050 RepID=UPI00261ECDB0|nr:ABC transporter permease [Bosea sp. (in: a-proteobacteria)]MCO5089850.1 ABC transporter permease [Bosea sp. (in: a-proteobacteria)]